jgi:NAD(P)-dependent dehydrogenase (short-subunit alcohol dehydrogenase family)
MTLIPNEECKTLVLTGASRGIGHATVKRFSSAGWRVISCSRQPFPEDCPWEAGPENHIQVDLADTDSTIRAIAEIKDRLKAQGSRLNALVNNAAVSPKGQGGSRLSSLDTPMEDWRHVFQVNFFAPLMLARGLIDELGAASGAVVNVSTIAGGRVHPFAGSAYATSKAALASLTRGMAADFVPRGIRSTPSRRARSTPIFCRPAPRLSFLTFPCAGSGSRRRWPKSSISCAPTHRATSMARSCTSMAVSMCDATHHKPATASV